jgi:predicted  nucleic acid-binding Zn-ribbon protein
VRDETALVIEQFAERMNARFDHVYTLFDGVFLRLDRLDSEYEALKAGLSRIEKRLVFLEERLTLVESELKSVRAGLAQLETRISALEEDSKQKAATQSQIFELTQQIALLNGRVAELEARRQ